MMHRRKHYPTIASTTQTITRSLRTRYRIVVSIFMENRSLPWVPSVQITRVSAAGAPDSRSVVIKSASQKDCDENTQRANDSKAHATQHSVARTGDALLATSVTAYVPCTSVRAEAGSRTDGCLFQRFELRVSMIRTRGLQKAWHLFKMRTAVVKAINSLKKMKTMQSTCGLCRKRAWDYM